MQRFLLIVLSAWALACTGCKSSKQEGARPAAPAAAPTSVEVRRGATIAVGKGPDAMLVVPARHRLYVANTDDDFISVIDTAADRPATPLDRIANVSKPMGFAWLGRGDRAKEVAVSTRGHEIAVIDAESDRVVRRAPVPDELSGIVATPDGQFLFAAATTGDRVLKLDAARLTVVGTYPTGKGPDGIGGTPDRDRLYVTNTGDGTISVLPPRGAGQELLRPGGKPELVSEAPDQSLLFVSNFDAGKVHVLDPATGRIVRELGGIEGAEGTALGPESLLYVVSFKRGRVYAFPSRGDGARQPVEYATGKEPIGIVATSNPPKIYVANYGDHTLSVFATGPAGPETAAGH
ncbi:MAG TPA: YncE family protein [Polyangia bacterium]|jgi:DNA-binding beta-propeller fold protein YncE|nr:YncE family protein [Polyangia bacterium]